METKICTKCNIEKSISDFGKRKNGLKSWCKSCNNEYKKEYNKKHTIKKRDYDKRRREQDIEKKREYDRIRYHENKHKFKEYTKKYYQENSQKLKDYQKKYREENKEKVKERDRIYRENNPEKQKIRSKIYRQKNAEKIKQYLESNSEKIKARRKRYAEKNYEKIKERRKIYAQKNIQKNRERHKIWREKNREKTRERINSRLSNDINFKLAHTLRNRTRDYIKKKKGIKQKTTSELVGCSWTELRLYLESKFKEGMTWENHGIDGWHIDHIRPCKSFDLTDPEQQKQCFHYTNLQPLWWWENLEKGGKWENTTSQ